MIPFVKISISDAEKKAVMKVLESGMIAQGPQVKEFETMFADYCGVKHAIALTSGTSALHTALYALGIKQNDEVITTPFTFVASANCIAMQNAKPVFADICPDTFNIDPKSVEKKITSKTKAIIPVDLFGHIYDIAAINDIANTHDLKILEDAAQSISAEYNDKRAGGFGHCAAFSFYATKNMITGEGGMLTTDNEEFAELARRFRHHGQSEQTRYQYYDLGYNYRMTDIQAAIGIEQLKQIDDITQKRIANAEKLNAELQHISGLEIPTIRDGYKHVFHQYTIKTDAARRDIIMQKIKENGVGCGIYYPKPLHLHPFYTSLGYKEGDFPVAEEMSKRVIALPIHQSLSDNDLEQIIEGVKKAIKK